MQPTHRANPSSARAGALPGALVAGLVALLVPAGAGAARPANLTGHDAAFLSSSIQGDWFEIHGAKIALRKSDDPKVRHLARVLRRDHTQSVHDAIDVANDLGVNHPSSPTESQQWELRILAGSSGHRFDLRYASLEVRDHQQDIGEAKQELWLGTNPDVRELAREDLPMLRYHLRLAHRAKRGVKHNH
jgi:putative membrane protein